MSMYRRRVWIVDAATDVALVHGEQGVAHHPPGSTGLSSKSTVDVTPADQLGVRTILIVIPRNLKCVVARKRMRGIVR